MPDKFVYREVVPGYIWAISRPFLRFNQAKVGGRASIIKLSNGDLFVISPVPLEEGTTKWVDAIGTVKYLVAPDTEHYMSLTEWKNAYPEAQMMGPKEVTVKLPHIKFDYLFTEWELNKTFGDDEIITHFFPGSVSKEIAFLHVPSKTLLNADLAENLPGKEQYSKTQEDAASGFLTGLFMKMFSPNNWIHNFVLLHAFTKDKAYMSTSKRLSNIRAMRRDAKVVSEWDFDRMIPCHGDVMETGAKKYWNELYVKLVN